MHLSSHAISSLHFHFRRSVGHSQMTKRQFQQKIMVFLTRQTVLFLCFCRKCKVAWFYTDSLTWRNNEFHALKIKLSLTVANIELRRFQSCLIERFDELCSVKFSLRPDVGGQGQWKFGQLCLVLVRLDRQTTGSFFSLIRAESGQSTESR